VIFGYVIGGLAIAYAGMVVLGAWLARELARRADQYEMPL
jgi:uncharacterized membrane protein YedE/YeeE